MMFTVPIRDTTNGALPATIYRVGVLRDGTRERERVCGVRTEKQKIKRSRAARIGIRLDYREEWVEIVPGSNP